MLTSLIFLIAIVLIVVGIVGLFGVSFAGILAQEYSPGESSHRKPMRISFIVLILGLLGIIWGIVRLFS